jgi:hypothetical protein
MHLLTLSCTHIGQRADERDMKLEVSLMTSSDGVVEFAVHPTEGAS